MNKHPLIGQTIGALRLKQPHLHRDSNYETASWWEERQLEPGIYPLKVGVASYGRDQPLTLYAEGTGVVTDSFFPSSFGGVMLPGSNPQKYFGEARQIKIAVGWKTAIQQTGSSPSQDGTLDLFVEAAKLVELETYFAERFLRTLATFDRMRPTDLTTIESIRTLGHLASWIEEDSELLGLIRQELKRSKETYFASLQAKNSAWATELQPA